MTSRELKLLQDGIREATLEKDDNKVRESIKNVISYMTSGVDVSSLFSDMVKVIYF